MHVTNSGLIFFASFRVGGETLDSLGLRGGFLEGGMVKHVDHIRLMRLTFQVAEVKPLFTWIRGHAFNFVAHFPLA